MPNGAAMCAGRGRKGNGGMAMDHKGGLHSCRLLMSFSSPELRPSNLLHMIDMCQHVMPQLIHPDMHPMSCCQRADGR